MDYNETIINNFKESFLNYLENQPIGLMGDKRHGGYFDVYISKGGFTPVNRGLKGKGPILLGKAIDQLFDEGKIEFKNCAYFLNSTEE